MVSIGLLALMMLMAGAVFKITLDSTGQAAALTDVNQELRVLEETLRQDLAQTPRDGAVLVIQANRVNAFWTRQTAEANSPGTDPDPFGPDAPYDHASDPEREDALGRMLQPRADVLMTFTAQPARSFLCPNVVGQVQQVVYGHAEAGELDSTGAWVGGAAPSAFADHLDGTGPAIFATPAEEWHLARRSVLIVDGIIDPGVCADVAHALDGSSSDDLHDGGVDVLAKRAFASATDFEYLKDVVGLKDVVDDSASSGEKRDWFKSWFARSRMDPAPPALVGNRLGHYFLPHCASFKVEWALDLRRIDSIPFNALPGQPDSAPQELVWFDPGRVDPATGAPDPLGELDDWRTHYLDLATPGSVGVAAALKDLKTTLGNRFDGSTETEGDPGMDLQTPVWYANDAPNNGGADEPDRYFPEALRITVDVFDANKKLDRPMRHVMVLPVGR